jgi:hypothetical protein
VVAHVYPSGYIQPMTAKNPAPETLTTLLALADEAARVGRLVRKYRRADGSLPDDVEQQVSWLNRQMTREALEANAA